MICKNASYVLLLNSLNPIFNYFANLFFFIIMHMLFIITGPATATNHIYYLLITLSKYNNGMKKLTGVPITWENSIEDFDKLSIKDFYSNVENFTEQFSKEFPLRNVEMHISQTSKKDGFDSKNFVIVL